MYVTNVFGIHSDDRRGVFARRQVAAVARRLDGITSVAHVGSRGVGGFFASRREVERMLTNEHPDIVHIIYGLSGLAVPVACEVPIVLTVCGSDVLWGPTTGSPRGLLEHVVTVATAWRAAAITAESRMLLSALPFDRVRSKGEVISPGVDSSLFRPLPRSDCRRELGWPLDEQVVLFPSARSRRVKRFTLAAATVDHVSSQGKLRVRMQTLEDVPSELVPLYHNAADCVLITSLWEGGPLAFYEALACGTPVVTVPVGYALDREWKSPYVKVVSPQAMALGTAVSDILRIPPPHQVPDDVTVPTHETYAERIVRLYERLLKPR